MIEFVERFRVWAVETEASTRSAALMRIGLASVLWSRYAIELVFFRHMRWDAVALSASFYVFTTMMLLGLFSRFSTLMSGIIGLSTYYYWGHALDNSWWIRHHTFTLGAGVFLLSFAPCGRSYSLDRWIALWREKRGGPKAAPERGNAMGLRLIQMQIMAMYSWTAYDKLHRMTFISGDRMEQIFCYYYFGFDIPTGWLFAAAMFALAWFTIVVEVGLGIGVAFEKIKPWALLGGGLLHAGIYISMPVNTFTATMYLLYLAFLDPDKIHALIDRLSGVASNADAQATGPPAADTG